MKKLLAMSAVVIAATFANAAAVTWTITDVYAGNTTDKASGIAYVFLSTTTFDASTWKNAETAMTWINANAIKNGSTVASWQGSNGNYTSGEFNVGSSAVNLEVGSTKYQFYAVVFDTDTVTDSSNYFVTGMNSKAKAIADSSSATAFALGSQATASQSASNWTAVPEPTSGLLLLLGMAGLALRRKHA